MLALTAANLKMMVRNRQTAFWALLFPVMLVVVFGLFDFSGVSSTNVAIIDLSQGPKSELLQARLQSIELLDVADLSEKTLDRAQAAEDLASGDLGYLVVIPPDFDAPRRCRTGRRHPRGPARARCLGLHHAKPGTQPTGGRRGAQRSR